MNQITPIIRQDVLDNLATYGCYQNEYSPKVWASMVAQETARIEKVERSKAPCYPNDLNYLSSAFGWLSNTPLNNHEAQESQRFELKSADDTDQEKLFRHYL